MATVDTPHQHNTTNHNNFEGKPKMKKNNPAFKDEVDEILDNGVLNHWTRSQIKTALDQAYQEKFLERLPEEKSLDNVGEFNFGYNFALSDVKAAITRGSGDE